MGKTTIEWATDTWNPVTGCTKVSAGCAHCYAERDFPRVYARHGRKFSDVGLHPERLDAPLRALRARRYFVNSMADLFHDDVPDEFLDRVFAVMAQARRHTFIVLTKRPERMHAYLTAPMEAVRLGNALTWLGSVRPNERVQGGTWIGAGHWNLPNLWLGVSAEDQATADQRIPLLLKTPAQVRCVSLEPLLGPINLAGALNDCRCGSCDYCTTVADHPTRRLDWVILGGESGPQARRCDLAWIRELHDQCEEAGVPCFVKQLGAEAVGLGSDLRLARTTNQPGRAGETFPLDLVDRKGGDMDEWPQDLRVREFPR